MIVIFKKIWNRTIGKIIFHFFRLIYKSIKIKERTALFISHPDFSDNTFPLFIELQKIGFSCCWIIYNDESKKIAKLYNVKTYSFRKSNSLFQTIRYARYQYLFTSHDIPLWIWKNNQYVYNCWHGSPFKKYRGRYLNNYEKGHYFLPPSKYALDLYIKTYERPIFKERCYPYRHFRTDYFIKEYGLQEKEKVSKFLNLKKYSKMIICCLTWMRDENSKKNQGTNLLGLSLSNDQIIQLNSELVSNNTILIIKPHPAYENTSFPLNLSNIKILFSKDLVNNNLQLYCFLALSSAMITDFSSILFDYCLLKKPVGHIIHNLDYYLTNQKEKFVYEKPTELMYGYKIKTFNDLLRFIKLTIKQNEELRNKLCNLYNEDNNLTTSSTKKFINEIIFKNKYNK